MSPFNCTINRLTDSTSFLKVKQSYKALKKAGKNTMNDDILFMAAQKKERIRYKKFRANYLQARGLNDR